MASSGTINFTQSATNSSGSYILGKIEWTAQAFSSDNDSKVTVRIYVKKANPKTTLTEPTYGSWSVQLKIADDTTNMTSTTSVLTDWVLLHTKSIIVAHGADGSKSLAISGSVTAPSSSDSYKGLTTQGSQTVTLDRIPRPTTIDSLTCSSNYLNGTITAMYTPKYSGFYNRRIVYVNDSGTLTEIRTFDLDRKEAKQLQSNINLTDDELSDIYDAAKNSNKATIRVTFQTYSDGAYTKQIGSDQYREIKLTLPTTVVPEITLEVSPLNTNQWIKDRELYVAGLSGATLKCSIAPGEGADLLSASLNHNKKSLSRFSKDTTQYEIANLSQSGDNEFVIEAWDKRLRSAKCTRSISVLPYFAPTVTYMQTERGTYKDGWTANDSGNDVRVEFRTTLALANEGNVYGVAFKIDDEDKTTDYSITAGLVSGDTCVVYFIGLDGNAGHALDITATDSVGYNGTARIVIPTTHVTIEFKSNGKGIAFGKTSEENAFECAWPAYFTAPTDSAGGGQNDVTLRVGADNEDHSDFYGNKIQAKANTTTTSGLYLNPDGGSVYAGDFRIPEIQHGTVTITPSAANTPTSAAITFSKTFSGTPNVIATARTSVPGTTVLGVGVSGISATGASIYVTRTNTTDTVVEWIAIY